MAKAKTKKRNKKGWLIALAVIALIVISVLISIEIGTYSPKENYYGNGTTWRNDAKKSLYLVCGQGRRKALASVIE